MDIQQIYTECCDSGCHGEHRGYTKKDMEAKGSRSCRRQRDGQHSRAGCPRRRDTNKNFAECDSKLHCKRLLSHSANKKLINYVSIKNCFSKTLNVATI